MIAKTMKQLKWHKNLWGISATHEDALYDDRTVHSTYPNIYLYSLDATALFSVPSNHNIYLILIFSTYILESQSQELVLDYSWAKFK